MLLVQQENHLLYSKSTDSLVLCVYSFHLLHVLFQPYFKLEVGDIYYTVLQAHRILLGKLGSQCLTQPEHLLSVKGDCFVLTPPELLPLTPPVLPSSAFLSRTRLGVNTSTENLNMGELNQLNHILQQLENEIILLLQQASSAVEKTKQIPHKSVKIFFFHLI